MTVTWQTTSPFAYLILRDFPELIWTKQLSGWPWGAYPQPTGNLSHPSAIKSYVLVLCFLEQITIHNHNQQCNLSYPNFWSQSHNTVHAKIIFQNFDTWTLSTQLQLVFEKWKQRSGDIGARIKVGSTDYRKKYYNCSLSNKYIWKVKIKEWWYWCT